MAAEEEANERRVPSTTNNQTSIASLTLDSSFMYESTKGPKSKAYLTSKAEFRWERNN